jgi:glutamate-1-semialdehyde 2,1-aminomutase
MFQFYLRAEGLALSWIGTGRIIFILNVSDADFAAVVDRFVNAGKAMEADGWWWNCSERSQPAIQRQIFWETVDRLVGRRRPA